MNQKELLKMFANYRSSVLGLYNTAIILNDTISSYKCGVSAMLMKSSSIELDMLRINGINNRVLSARPTGQSARNGPEVAIYNSQISELGELLGIAHNNFSKQNRYIWSPTQGRGRKNLQRLHRERFRRNLQLKRRQERYHRQQVRLDDELSSILERSSLQDNAIEIVSEEEDQIDGELQVVDEPQVNAEPLVIDEPLAIDEPQVNDVPNIVAVQAAEPESDGESSADDFIEDGFYEDDYDEVADDEDEEEEDEGFVTGEGMSNPSASSSGSGDDGSID